MDDGNDHTGNHDDDEGNHNDYSDHDQAPKDRARWFIYVSLEDSYYIIHINILDTCLSKLLF